jgi:predicted nicotinamide N-methyase
VIEQIVALPGRDLELLRPGGSEYWAELWPSAEALARTLADRALRGRRVLEIGCGLGLPSLAAAAAGGRVLASDRAPDAVEAVRRNATRNGLELEAALCDWSTPDDLLARGPWDLVLAADVAYEHRSVEPLSRLLRCLDCEAWLADPGRAPARTLVADLELAGWSVGTMARETAPTVTVQRLRPPREAGRMS